MRKILGIDTGTNSLGWAIVEQDDNNNYSLLEYGTNIFQEGVKIEKGIESSKASERTEHRSQRKHYWRRKVRKIRLLTILSQYGLCPNISHESLRLWRTQKKYPNNDAFIAWQRTEDKENINPYYFRHVCLTRHLDMSCMSDRYILGRALYHLNQRRGFLSNRKEETKEINGKVTQGITKLSEDMTAAGCEYLGEYFYRLYQSGEKIRNKYTSRNEHYLSEFHAICKMQELNKELVDKLEKAIFSQRPLKSQKQQLGKCTFEPKKPRCPLSHPLYEDFRMYSFINNIKIQTPKDYELRPLTQEEKRTIKPLFLRKSKQSFHFEDIAKKLSSGKNSYCHVADKADKPYKFNYHMDTNVSNSPINAGLAEIFGEDWLDSVCEVYSLTENKSRTEILNDIWHVLFCFDDENKLKDFGINRLQLSESDAEKFSKIKTPQGYASLSLKAIKKILPYLKYYGLIYSEAVFLANLCEVLPSDIWNVKEMREAAIENIIEVMHQKHALMDEMTMEQRVKNYIKEQYDVEDKRLNSLYHPSMLDVYTRQRPDDEGIYQLGSPRINSVRNPMAMHSLFRLRKVVNQMLKEKKIDENTIIHIEFSRDLNDANKRKAIQTFQRDNEKRREEYRRKIAEIYKDLGIGREPTDTDILKYQLWEEQAHKCLYTGEEISLKDFLGDNPRYDIEHTVPRSVGGDSTMMNLTLCQNTFNRNIKGAKLPSKLANHEEILQRIESWKKKFEELDKQIRKSKGAFASTKEIKDKNIQKRHLLTQQRDYWRGKYQRFTMEEVPEGFSRRQGTDISVISRYARLYLKSVFRHVHIVKGIATSDFRKIWGIQDEYTKKERVNHCHHCIDAITIACIGLAEYGKLAHYYHELEDHEMFGSRKPQFEKPWPTFVEDIKNIPNELLIAHYTQDNMPKAARRRVDSPQGRVLAKGDVARGSLHQDTYYGAIERDGEIKYVVRKTLANMEEKDIKNIVDDEVRQKVEQAVKKHGSLAKAIEADGIWMNRDKGVRISKVRCFLPIQRSTLNIRQHRDTSKYEYKKQYHVWNGDNYMLAIYEGKNAKGRVEREFEEVKNIDAANYYKRSNDTKYSGNNDIVPIRSPKGYPLLCKIKTGTMVLLYEKRADEIWDLDKCNIVKRLYKIIGISLSDGRLSLLYHQEARPTSEIIQKDGAFCSNEVLRPRIRIRINQFKALIEGVDFKMNDLGEITRLI